MKKIYTLSIAMVCLLLFAVTAKLVSFTGGAPINSTGSPSNKNLTCVQCHASNNTEKLNWIVGKGLENGYVAGNQYDMVAKASTSGCEKFGFLLTIEKSDGTKAGLPMATDAVRTQVKNDYYLTHTQAGTVGVDSIEWEFKWAAPQTQMGTVTMYGAFLAANGDNQNIGDKVFVTKKSFVLYGTQGIPQVGANTGATLYSFPNPASSIINLTLDSPVRNGKLSIFALNGTLVKSVYWAKADEMQVDISALPVGTYITRFEWENDIIIGKVIIRR